jgi:hypothetical protein
MQRSDEEIQSLLMGLMDGELSAEEANEVNDLLRKNQALRDEYESLLQAHEHLKGLTFDEPEDAVLKRLWKSPYSRFAHDASLWMILGGYLFLFCFGLWAFFTSGSEGWQVKIPIAAIAVGVTVLLFLKIRERFATYNVDPYKEVKR